MSDLLTLLSDRASARPERLFARFLETGDASGPIQELSYGDLQARSHAVGARLLEGGCAHEPVLLLFPPGLEFLSAFLGTACAGAIAVPLAPPSGRRLERTLPRIEAVARDCAPRFVLTTRELASLQPRCVAQAPTLAACSWIAVDDLDEALASDYARPAGAGAGLCHLQYTSGSTGTPKGVRISHQNVLHNLSMIEAAVGEGHSHEVSWLPAYHDMGLIGGLLQPLYHDASLTLLAPVSFLRKPLRWIEAISAFGATASGAPDFAYALVAKKASEAFVAKLDLSAWRTAFCGAEPIRASTRDAFLARFAPAGLRPEAFAPTYGLAEATLIVAMRGIGAPSRSTEVDPAALEEGRVEPGARQLVSSGRILAGCDVRIVDPEARVELPPNRVGELWVRGASVAEGYHEQPELSEEVFGARLAGTEEGAEEGAPFLRTGDLAFLDPEGELYVTGRRKDLLIVHGRNVYPQDLEHSLEECHPGVRRAAAFSIEAEDEERVVLALEVDRRAPEDLAAIHRAALHAIATEHELAVWGVALVKRGGLPQTTSGKLQRYATRRAYLEGALPTLARFEGAAPADDGGEVASGKEAATRLRRASEISAWLQAWIASATGYAPEDVEVDMPLVGYGLDSAQAVELASALGERVGQELDPALTFDYPTIREMAGALAVGESGAGRVEVSTEDASPAAGAAGSAVEADARAKTPAGGAAASEGAPAAGKSAAEGPARATPEVSEATSLGTSEAPSSGRAGAEASASSETSASAASETSESAASETFESETSESAAPESASSASSASSETSESAASETSESETSESAAPESASSETSEAATPGAAATALEASQASTAPSGASPAGSSETSPEDRKPAPPLRTSDLVLMDLVFFLFTSASAGSGAVAALSLARLMRDAGAPLWALGLALPLLAGIGLVVFGLVVWTLRLMLPAPRAGIHPLGSAEARAWGLHFMLQRTASLPLWRPVFQSVASLRWLLLRALGADVPFRFRSAMDAELLDVYLLSVGEDAMLAGGTSVSAHLTAGDRLHLARVEIGASAELWAGASVALGCEVGERTTIGVRTMILPHVKIGPGCTIGSFARIGEGTRIGAGAAIGEEVIVGRGCVIDPGARVPAGSRLAPGTRVRAGA